MVDHWLGISSADYDSSCGADAEATVPAALDGYNNWVHSVNEIHWFILDLGQTYTIKKVKGRSYSTNDPTNINIYVSDDKENWGTAVKTGIQLWQDTQTFYEYNTTEKNGRYIKVEIEDTEDANRAINWIGTMYPAPIFDAYGDAVGIDTVTYYFNSKSTSVWADSEKMIDDILTNYATTSSDGDTEVLDGNTCPGIDLGIISKVELRIYAHGDGNDRIDLTPVFGGADDGDTHQTTPGTVPNWRAYQDITIDTNAPFLWSWSDVQNLDCKVVFEKVAKANIMYCAKVEVRVTFALLICEGYINQIDCEAAAGCYWYDGSCHSSPQQPEICDWIDSKGGPTGLTVPDFYEFADSYSSGIPPPGYTFVPTIINVYGILDYYLGFNGDAKTGCDFYP